MTKLTMFEGGERMLFANAADMRPKPKHAEDVLWSYLRTKPMGCKFRRQHVFGIYILDFYCHALQLVIEVDGSVHDSVEAQLADKTREQFLEPSGLFLMRYRNKTVETGLPAIQQHIELSVKEKLLQKKSHPPKSPL